MKYTNLNLVGDCASLPFFPVWIPPREQRDAPALNLRQHLRPWGLHERPHGQDDGRRGRGARGSYREPSAGHEGEGDCRQV